MTQAHINLIQNNGLYIVRNTHTEVTCRIGLSEELKIKKVKGEIKLHYKDDKTKFTISEDIFNKLYDIAESIQMLTSFLRGSQDV